ncbi:MAG: PfkB family carbohydrate kinase [Dehalococcoidia bacterium]|jgi:D-beta-D-heptose 7-phosphate kinase/D-beta-D-heptose 1-phosphate adenosyltransferase
MKKVLVIGDSCLDMFIYGNCSRLCPEAPVPIFNPLKTVGNGGMAINVYENLKALGVQCDILTNDLRPVKTRYVDEVSNQMLLRVDQKDSIFPMKREDLDKLDLNDYDAIVISDYNKGFLSIEDIVYISNNHSLTFMDSKKRIYGWCDYITHIKINQKEFLQNEGYLIDHYPGDLIVTEGRLGATRYYDDDGEIKNESFPILEEHDVRDLSGAGDTFLAALVAKYLENSDICEAIRFANKCAAWVVTQKGVVVIDTKKVGL